MLIKYLISFGFNVANLRHREYSELEFFNSAKSCSLDFLMSI